MAFFKEKRTGNLGTVTKVDWGKNFRDGINLTALNKFYQRKHAQRVKDLELSPEMFDTTFSAVEAELQEEINNLYTQYLDVTDIVSRTQDLSPENRDARKKQKEILKYIANYKNIITKLETDEDTFVKTHGENFFPDAINTHNSGHQIMLQEAYTDLMNGVYKSGKDSPVKGVRFEGGKMMVKIDNGTEIIEVPMSDLRPFDQPNYELRDEITTSLSGIATNASTKEGLVQARIDVTTTMGDMVSGKYNINDYRDILNMKYAVPVGFSKVGDEFHGTVGPMTDDDYLKLFQSTIVNHDDVDEDGNPVYDTSDPDGNWTGFYHPGVREDNNMQLADGVDQNDIEQDIENFLSKWVLDLGTQMLNAGERMHETGDDKIGLYDQKQRIDAQTQEGGAHFLEEMHTLTQGILADENKPTTVLNPDGTQNEEYATLFTETLIDNLNQITEDGEWVTDAVYKTKKDAELNALDDLTVTQLKAIIPSLDQSGNEVVANLLTMGDEVEDVSNETKLKFMDALFNYRDQDGNTYSTVETIPRGTQVHVIKDDLYNELTRGIKAKDLVDYSKTTFKTGQETDKELDEFNKDMRGIVEWAGSLFGAKNIYGNPVDVEALNKFIQHAGTLVTSIRNSLFRNVIAKGIQGRASYDMILKHIDDDGVISYHGMDIFRGDTSFEANLNAAQRLREITHIDDNELFSRGLQRFLKKYKKIGVQQ